MKVGVLLFLELFPVSKSPGLAQIGQGELSCVS